MIEDLPHLITAEVRTELSERWERLDAEARGEIKAIGEAYGRTLQAKARGEDTGLAERLLASAVRDWAWTGASATRSAVLVSLERVAALVAEALVGGALAALKAVV